MTMPDALIFDLDGTLIHSAPDLHAAANAMLRHMDRPEQDLATTISFIGNGVEVLVQRCLAASGGGDEAIQAKALAQFHTHYEKNLTVLTQPYDGVLAVLDQAQAAGIAMAVCTNKPQGPARAICDALDLSPYFANITGALPDVPKKPDPTSLLGVLDDLGARPAHSLYVGDSLVDHETALNACVPFRLFDGGYLKGRPHGLDPSHRFAHWSEANLLPAPHTAATKD